MESKLVLILTQAESEFPVNEIFAKLRESSSIVEALTDANDAERSVEFYQTHVGESLKEAKILVAGIGIPVDKLVNVAPNLDVIVTIDPTYNGRTLINGGPRTVKVMYLHNPPNKYLELGTNITKIVLDYLANGTM